MPEIRTQTSNRKSADRLSFDDFKEIVLKDYRMAVESRQVSLMGRKEVLTGEAKFGVFGEGKELGQITMGKHIRPA